MTAAAPLAGLRVVDLSRVLAGPWATQLLADLGADVIKVERPGAGDDTRAWGPPFMAGEDGAAGLSGYFASANRGKRSITIDMAVPAGQDLIRELSDQADIFVENFKVGGLAQFGLDHETLAQRNPRLIYCSITGFGQSGPHRGRPGYDLLVQAMGGLMSLTGEEKGPPLKVGVAIADIMTGLYATSAILAALHERERSGRGDHIDLALLDVQIATLANQAQNYLVGGRIPPRLGNVHPNIAPYQDFATADGEMVVAVGNDGQFARFCACLGAPDLAGDPRFATNAARIENRDELVAAISRAMGTRTTDDWLQRLDDAGIPASGINTLDRVFADPQVAARDLLVTPGASAEGSPLVGNPIHLKRNRLSYERYPPALGAHTVEVLRDILGKDPSEIDTLARGGAI